MAHSPRVILRSVLMGRLEHSAGGIVIGPDARMVLTTHRKRGVSFPKGHVEKGETAKKAARREIREEAGITDLTEMCRLGSFVRRTKGLRFKRIELFLFSTDQKALAPTDRKHTAGWYSPDAAYLRLRSDRPRDASQILKHLRRIKQVQAQVLNARPLLEQKAQPQRQPVVIAA
jgi:8-oxo-dGTP pyrophosphatase MutT (NUDIX family)